MIPEPLSRAAAAPPARPVLASKYLSEEERARLDAIAATKPELVDLQDRINAYVLLNTAALDEIDARATAFLRNVRYGHHDQEPFTGALRLWVGRGEPIICARLSRSRDALKAARPLNWWFRQDVPSRFEAIYLKDGFVPVWPIAVQGFAAYLEELRELSCLLMVVDQIRDSRGSSS